MKDEEKNREKLIAEIKELRKEIIALREKTEKKPKTLFCELRNLFDDANDLIQSVSDRGEFLYVNKKWRDTLGYSEEEVKGLDIFDVVHPDSQEHCRDVFQKIMAGENISMVEADFITKNGKRISVEGNVNCRFDGGKPAATRAIFRDVTERKKKQSDEIIKGGSEHLKVAELIQICNFFVPDDSVVSVTNRRGKVGEVYISKGNILHARTGKLSGKKALFRMLGWEAGVYAINQKELDQEASIGEPLENCLLEGARELDEFNALKSGIEKEGNSIEIEFSDELMKRRYDPITAEVLSLAIKYKRIDRILDECEYTDLETMKAIVDLLQKRIIRTV